MTSSVLEIKSKNITRRVRPTLAPVCGVCDTICIYSAVELVFIIGIMANILVLIRVIRDKELQRPTFVALAQLALSEALFLLFHTMINIELILHRNICYKRTEAWSYVSGILAIFWFSAALHVTLLAAIRYIVLAHPVRALTLLTNKRIIAVSIGISLSSVAIFGAMMLGTKLSEVKGKANNYVRITTWVLTYFAPIVLTAVLHFVKMSVVRKSSRFRDQTPEKKRERQKSAMRMVTIITIVIVAGVILPFPRLIYTIVVDICKVQIKDSTLRAHFKGVSGLLFLLSFSINPFIYSFKSVMFRRSLQKMKTSVNSWKYQLSSEDLTQATSVGTPEVRAKSISLSNVGSSENTDDFKSLEQETSVNEIKSISQTKMVSNKNLDDSNTLVEQKVCGE